MFGRRSPLATVSLFAALAVAPMLAACDADEDPTVAAEAFEDGMAKDTDGGAFRVVLTSRDGMTAGENALIVHVGFHDPNDPEAPGRGIPNADVQLDAHMANGAAYYTGGEPTYLGEGDYLFEDLTLTEGGVWNFDFAIAVGETMDESVSFAVVIPE